MGAELIPGPKAQDDGGSPLRRQADAEANGAAPLGDAAQADGTGCCGILCSHDRRAIHRLLLFNGNQEEAASGQLARASA